jgi:hypothetical protein
MRRQGEYHGTVQRPQSRVVRLVCIFTPQKDPHSVVKRSLFSERKASPDACREQSPVIVGEFPNSKMTQCLSKSYRDFIGALLPNYLIENDGAVELEVQLAREALIDILSRVGVILEWFLGGGGQLMKVAAKDNVQAREGQTGLVRPNLLATHVHPTEHPQANHRHLINDQVGDTSEFSLHTRGATSREWLIQV